MDQFIKALDQRNLELALKTLDNNSDMFKGLSGTKKAQLLSSLNFTSHSLVILYIVEDFKNNPESILIFNRFLNEFDYNQIKHRFRQFVEVCRQYVNVIVENKAGIKIVRALKNAIIRINNHEEGLSTLNTIYAKLIIQTKTYRSALELIDRPITCFNKHSDTNEEDIYNYFYYCGHIYMALERFEEAFVAFRLSMQLSSNYIYSSTLNARKKMILLTIRDPKIIYNSDSKKFKLDYSYENRMLNFSKNLSSDEIEVLNLFCKAYVDLMEDEKLQKYENFDKYLTDNLEVYAEDKNLGLVKEIYSSFRLRKLKELKKVYDTLPLSDVIKEIDSKPEQLTSNLIKVFNIRSVGRIDVANEALVFEPAYDAYKLKNLRKLHALTNKLKDVSHEFNKEHDGIIKDRIAMPNTIFS